MHTETCKTGKCKFLFSKLGLKNCYFELGPLRELNVPFGTRNLDVGAFKNNLGGTVTVFIVHCSM